MTDDRTDLLRKLVADIESQLSTTKELLRLLLIADLLGVSMGSLRGGVRTHVEYGYSARKPWVAANLVIQIDNSTTMVPMVDVPHELWPQDMLEAYKRAG